MDIAQLISEYGFPVVMAVGMGYFLYYVVLEYRARQQVINEARLNEED
jgi:hypothetical protein